jgi:hypothetical protein
MRIRGLSWMVLLLALVPGCGLDVIEVEVVQDGFAALAGATFPGMNQFGVSLEDALQAKDINPGDVDSLRVLSGSIEMTSKGGVTKDLAFIQKMEFWVAAPGQTTVLLASAPSFPKGTTKKDFTLTKDLELKPYLATGQMAVTLDAPLVQPPIDTVELRVRFRLRVDVNVI